MGKKTAIKIFLNWAIKFFFHNLFLLLQSINMIHSHVKMEEKRFKDDHPKLAEITLKERHLYSTD